MHMPLNARYSVWVYINELSSKTPYCDVKMGTIASQITSLTIVYSTVYSGADQWKHQSSASLAFVWVPGEFPAQIASNAENVSIWWRHHGSHFLQYHMWHDRLSSAILINISPQFRRPAYSSIKNTLYMSNAETFNSNVRIWGFVKLQYRIIFQNQT